MPAVRFHHHSDFDPALVAAAKGARAVAVVLPARNEAATVGTIVAAIVDTLRDRHGLVDDIVVVDDGSADGTGECARRAGARVVEAEGTGKGAAMWSGVQATDADLVVFCDADLVDFDPHVVTALCGPLVADDDVTLVKAAYERLLDGRPGEGGRVTSLTARPALRLLAPEVASVLQPLGGEYAAPRRVLEDVPFVDGYGVDVGLLLDIAARYGADRIAQVDVGRRSHRNRPLTELAEQAEAVLHTILDRAGRRDVVPVDERAPLRLSVSGGGLVVARANDAGDAG